MSGHFEVAPIPAYEDVVRMRSARSEESEGMDASAGAEKRRMQRRMAGSKHRSTSTMSESTTDCESSTPNSGQPMLPQGSTWTRLWAGRTRELAGRPGKRSGLWWVPYVLTAATIQVAQAMIYGLCVWQVVPSWWAFVWGGIMILGTVGVAWVGVAPCVWLWGMTDARRSTEESRAWFAIVLGVFLGTGVMVGALYGAELYRTYDETEWQHTVIPKLPAAPVGKERYYEIAGAVTLGEFMVSRYDMGENGDVFATALVPLHTNITQLRASGEGARTFVCWCRQGCNKYPAFDYGLGSNWADAWPRDMQRETSRLTLLRVRKAGFRSQCFRAAQRLAFDMGMVDYPNMPFGFDDGSSAMLEIVDMEYYRTKLRLIAYLTMGCLTLAGYVSALIPVYCEDS